MILTGSEINKRIKLGQIKIDPFDIARINPNSYNLSLHNELLVYTKPILDLKVPNETKRIIIPENGYILQPTQLYLGRTTEFTETYNCVPMIEGRSSLGRLGIFIHITAGFGDTGFKGYWTLEICVIKPTRIYPNIQVCQIYYHEVVGDIVEYKSNKYQNNRDIQSSMMFKDFDK
jgi:dCTP deaminase